MHVCAHIHTHTHTHTHTHACTCTCTHAHIHTHIHTHTHTYTHNVCTFHSTANSRAGTIKLVLNREVSIIQSCIFIVHIIMMLIKDNFMEYLYRVKIALIYCYLSINNNGGELFRADFHTISSLVDSSHYGDPSYKNCLLFLL